MQCTSTNCSKNLLEALNFCTNQDLGDLRRSDTESLFDASSSSGLRAIVKCNTCSSIYTSEELALMSLRLSEIVQENLNYNTDPSYFLYHKYSNSNTKQSNLQIIMEKFLLQNVIERLQHKDRILPIDSDEFNNILSVVSLKKKPSPVALC